MTLRDSAQPLRGLRHHLLYLSATPPLPTRIRVLMWGDQCTGARSNAPRTGCGIFTTTHGTATEPAYSTSKSGDGITISRWQLDNTQALLNYELALYEAHFRRSTFIVRPPDHTRTHRRRTANSGSRDGKESTPTLRNTAVTPTGGQSPPVTSGQRYLTATLDSAQCGSPTPTPTAIATATPTSAPCTTYVTTTGNAAYHASTVDTVTIAMIARRPFRFHSQITFRQTFNSGKVTASNGSLYLIGTQAPLHRWLSGTAEQPVDHGHFPVSR